MRQTLISFFDWIFHRDFEIFNALALSLSISVLSQHGAWLVLLLKRTPFFQIKFIKSVGYQTTRARVHRKRRFEKSDFGVKAATMQPTKCRRTSEFYLQRFGRSMEDVLH